MDRQEDGSFDPSTYCEYWLYKDAVCPVTDTICLCTACRVSLGRRDFHKFSKRNAFDMFDNYPEELAILNPLETALVSIIISEASSGDPFAFSTLRQPRCMKLMALVGLMVTLWALLLDDPTCTPNQAYPRFRIQWLTIAVVQRDHTCKRLQIPSRARTNAFVEPLLFFTRSPEMV